MIDYKKSIIKLLDRLNETQLKRFYKLLKSSL